MERWKITYLKASMQRVCDIGTLSKAESHLETSMQRDCDMGTLGKAESYLGDVREWEAIIQGEGRLGSC